MPPSRNSRASRVPVDAPEGTAARPRTPLSSQTSASTVGLCRFAFGDAFTLTWQLAAFSAFSILYLVVLRRWLKKLFMGGRVETKTDFDNEYVGRVGRVVEAINPPLAGRVIIGDAEWTATSDEPMAAGATAEVVSQSNLTMKVKEVK